MHPDAHAIRFENVLSLLFIAMYVAGAVICAANLRLSSRLVLSAFGFGASAALMLANWLSQIGTLTRPDWMFEQIRLFFNLLSCAHAISLATIVIGLALALSEIRQARRYRRDDAADGRRYEAAATHGMR